MLTIKKRARLFGIFFSLVSFLFLTSCSPPGHRELRKGARLIEDGKFLAAVEKLEAATKLLAKDPPAIQAQAWNHLGLALHRSSQVPQAVQAYQHALKLDRNLAAADFNLGCAQLDQRNFPAAIDALMTFVALQPKEIDGFLKLAEAQMQLAAKSSSAAERNRQLDNARKSFESAEKISSTAEALNGLGLIQLQRNRTASEAIRSFRAALQKQTNYAPALLNLAVVYHQTLNDHALALQKYREYLALQPRPENWKAVENIARELDAELNPHPQTPSTNAVARTSTTPTVVATNKISQSTNKTSVPANPTANVVVSPKPETNIPKPTPASTPPPPKIAATNSTPVTAPAAKAAPVEVIKLEEAAPIKPAQDVSVTPLPKIVSNNTAGIVEVKTNAESKATTEGSTKKTSLVGKLNPATWFGKKNKTPVTTPLTNSAPNVTTNKAPPKPAESRAANVAQAAATSASPTSTTPVPPKPAPVVARYKYFSPTKATAGNRAEATKFFSQAVKAQRAKHLSEAITAYRSAVKSDPTYFDGWFYFGLAASEANDSSTSLTALENALVIQPESIDARYAFAWSLQRANFPQDAANELEKLLGQKPNETRAHLLLANLYAQKLEQPKLARGHYLKVIEAEPAHPQATAIRYWLAGNP